MHSGIVVAGFHRFGQREENGFGFVQGIDERFTAQHSADAGAHHGGLERLHQKFVGAGFDSRDFVFGALHAGHHQDGDELSAAIRFQGPAEVRPAHSGHDHSITTRSTFSCSSSFSAKEGRLASRIR